MGLNPNRKVLQLQVDLPLYERLKMISFENRRSVPQTINWIMEDWFKHEELLKKQEAPRLAQDGIPLALTKAEIAEYLLKLQASPPTHKKSRRRVM